jgi:hypothetical protein
LPADESDAFAVPVVLVVGWVVSCAAPRAAPPVEVVVVPSNAGAPWEDVVASAAVEKSAMPPSASVEITATARINGEDFWVVCIDSVVLSRSVWDYERRMPDNQDISAVLVVARASAGWCVTTRFSRSSRQRN